MSRLFYLMGASGSGKDALLSTVRAHLPSRNACVAHRYITRSADNGGENHICLTSAEFEFRQARGLFALHWESHGFSYGIGSEIDSWLQVGIQVLVNGSRGYLPAARQRYPDLVPVLIQVDDVTLKARLLNRGRENSADITRRLERNRRFAQGLPGPLVVLNNTGTLAAGTRQLLQILADHS